MSVANGLKTDSLIRLDLIATLQKKTIVGELGVAEPAVMREVAKKLKTLFGL
jgi:mRNA-degrading endonuclease toxin of MazEF toxin-antitoxin module